MLADVVHSLLTQPVTDMHSLVVHNCMQCMSLCNYVQDAEVLLMPTQVLCMFTHGKA